MGIKTNILFFKFSLVLGGGERFNLVLGEELKKMGCSLRFFSNYKPFVLQLRKKGISAKKIYWGREAGARRNLPEYFLLLPFNLLRFLFILIFNKKVGVKNIVFFQSLNEKIFATPIAKFLGYKVFWVEHLSIHPWLVKNFLKKKYINKSKKADKIIVISNLIKNELTQDLDIDEEKIEVVYNGVDLKTFFPLDEKTIENEKKKFALYKESKILGYVGRLHEEKGLDILLNSFYQLSRRFDHLYLFLIGDGPERKILERNAVGLGIEKKVIFLGYRSDINLLLNVIDIFILPSKLRESFGIVLIEAMACGKIVVASNLGGIPEIIENGLNGFLFTAGSEKELTDILSKLLSDDNLREKTIDNALKTVKEKFSLDIMVKKIERLLV